MAPHDSEIVAAALLIAVPIAFNLAFFELGRAFDYPDILRKEPDEILRRFAAGGSGLLLRWQALLLSALAMLPLVALAGGRRWRRQSALTVALDRHRRGRGARPGARPGPLAVRRAGARASLPRGSRGSGRGRDPGHGRPSSFATLHRLLGVGIGEHLGYLLTGLWTLLVAVFDPLDGGAPGAGWASSGCRSAWRCSSGTLEFVGPNERDGWRLAGTIVPIAYIAWSLWLIALGVFLLL